MLSYVTLLQRRYVGKTSEIPRYYATLWNPSWRHHKQCTRNDHLDKRIPPLNLYFFLLKNQAKTEHQRFHRGGICCRAFPWNCIILHSLLLFYRTAPVWQTLCTRQLTINFVFCNLNCFLSFLGSAKDQNLVTFCLWKTYILIILNMKLIFLNRFVCVCVSWTKKKNLISSPHVSLKAVQIPVS